MFLICLGVAALATGTLLYEVSLTRLFSIAYGYHFAFLAISVALLGFGASGTLAALRPQWSERLNAGHLARLALVGSVVLFTGYVIANHVPFDPYRVAWEPSQLFLLAAYLLSFTAPFLLVGLALGMPLSAWPDRAGALYGANLAGSGVGALLALAVLNRASLPAAIVLAALLAASSSIAFSLAGEGGAGARLRRRGLRLLAPASVVAAFGLLLWHSPAWLETRLSPYKPLSQILNYPDSRVLYRASNALAHLDVVESSAIRFAPGLSLAYQGRLPRQTGIVVDGESVLALTAEKELRSSFLDAMPTALAYRLRPRARVAILEPGGGLEVLAALRGRARSVVVVEKNPLLAQVVQRRFATRAGGVYSDPRVRLVVSNPRRYFRRSDHRFDLIALALSENRRTLSAGGFSLSENYPLTREAFEGYLEHLAPGGLLVVQRWLQLPPTEELRAAAALVEALDKGSDDDTSKRIIALRSFSTMLILAKREGFDENELAVTKDFARARQFDLVHYPGMKASEANRFNVLRDDPYHASFRRLLEDRERFYEQYEYDVRPATDHRPFFFHFFKWEQTPTVLALLGRTWQPFGGSGYLIVVALLVLVTLLSLGLILLPAAAIRRRQGQSPAGARWRGFGLYFGALGLGFLLAEVALVQRFILLLDHSAQALSAVLFGVLVSSGIGSLLSHRLPWRRTLATLVVLLALYPLVLTQTFSALLAQSLLVRVLATAALLAPLGFLMGVPFPTGLRALADGGRSWLPMAWAVNGFASVISAVLAAMFALSWGFTFVFAAAALAYLVALLAIWNRGGEVSPDPV